jgi:hypothetical protein
MYYSHPCTYCRKVFYTYNTNKEQAAETLYHGIKKHLIDYNEDHKEYDMDDGAEMDTDQIYYALEESQEPPSGGYEV